MRLTGLSDKTFFVAEGEWTLYDCQGCGAAYLDPRPDSSSIGRAYAHYYTHRSRSAVIDAFFWQRRDLKSRVQASYVNARYGYSFDTAFSLVTRAIRNWDRLQLGVDHLIRHLPPPRSPGAKLLDVGAGNGDYVALAQSLGYRAMGLEPDAAAISAGRSPGLDIRQGILPDPDFREMDFEHVTLNHVIEHLHEPRDAVRQILDLLVPGGRLWLSQPNIGALGLKRFGKNWRGLEPPRHLSLYDPKSLTHLLTGAGFTDIRLLPAPRAAEFYYRQSAAMSADRDPNRRSGSTWTKVLMSAARKADSAASRDPAVGESFTMTARRP